MPHFALIRAGAKYWKRQAVDTARKGATRAKEYIPVRVLGKNEQTMQVLASIGGMPAEWVDVMLSARWLTCKEKELEERI